MKKESAERIVRETRCGYDAIAPLFEEKRNYLWPEMRRLACFVRKGDTVLDFGCGFGRLIDAFRACGVADAIGYAGVDISPALIAAANKKYPGSDFFAILGHCTTLPFPDGFFNAAYAIASLHHIPSAALRNKTIAEFSRILKKNGMVIASVWHVPPKKAFFLALRYTFLRLSGRMDIDKRDVYIPWKDNSGASRAERYVHLFTKKELAKLFSENGFVVRMLYGKENNIYIIAQKK